MEWPYRVLFNYHTEGWQFLKDFEKGTPVDYATVNQAVKAAIKESVSREFIVVKMINWEASEK